MSPLLSICSCSFLLPSRCRYDPQSRALWILSSRSVSGTRTGSPAQIRHKALTKATRTPSVPLSLYLLHGHLFVDLPLFQLVNPVPQQRPFLCHPPERSRVKSTGRYLDKKPNEDASVWLLDAGFFSACPSEAPGGTGHGLQTQKHTYFLLSLKKLGLSA